MEEKAPIMVFQVTQNQIEEIAAKAANRAIKDALYVPRSVLIEEACQLLGVSHVTLINMVKKGAIAAKKERNKWTFTSDEIERVRPLMSDIRYSRSKNKKEVI